MKWSKCLTTAVLCLTLLFGTAPLSAFANGFTQSPSVGSATLTMAPEESADGTTGGLTPEGNLTIVDDVKDSSTGKEFITVVTKNGNYFYIVIDRDAKGNATVHFLNLVDERDLLPLLSEEEVQEYQEQQAIKPTVPEETPPTDPTPTEPAPPEPDNGAAPQMNRDTVILLCIPILVLIVGGIASYFIFSRKKPKTVPTDENDEDDWNYDYDLPEEEDDVSYDD